MGELDKLRSKISVIDEQLLERFATRMELIAKVAAHKKKNQGAVFAPKQEQAKIQEAKGKLSPQLEMYAEGLMQSLLRLSRERQYELMMEQDHTWALGKTLEVAKKDAVKIATISIVAGLDACGLVVGKFYPEAHPVIASDSTQGLNQVQTGAVDLALLPCTEEVYTFLAEQTLFISAYFDLPGGEPLVAVAAKFMLPANSERASLLIQFSQNRQELSLTLGIFADLQIPLANLCVMGERLYLEFSAHPENKRALRALYQLEQETPEMRLLGWYPTYCSC